MWKNPASLLGYGLQTELGICSVRFRGEATPVSSYFDSSFALVRLQAATYYLELLPKGIT